MQLCKSDITCNLTISRGFKITCISKFSCNKPPVILKAGWWLLKGLFKALIPPWLVWGHAPEENIESRGLEINTIYTILGIKLSDNYIIMLILHKNGSSSLCCLILTVFLKSTQIPYSYLVASDERHWRWWYITYSRASNEIPGYHLPRDDNLLEERFKVSRSFSSPRK